MCFSANMSLSLGVVGVIASSITFLDKSELFWVRMARTYAIFHFALMEFIQYFAYPVADQCGYGTNLWLSELSTYHICLQAFAIMPALATYSSDLNALKRATQIGGTLSGLFIICSFLPQKWQLLDVAPNFIGDMVACLFMGKYHIGYQIPSAFGLFVTHGSLFALALSGFLWKQNHRIASYPYLCRNGYWVFQQVKRRQCIAFFQFLSPSVSCRTLNSFLKLNHPNSLILTT
jgi:hypothetical protein